MARKSKYDPSQVSTENLRRRAAHSLDNAQVNLREVERGDEKAAQRYKFCIESWMADTAEINRRMEAIELEVEKEEFLRMEEEVELMIQDFSSTLLCTRMDGTTYEAPKPDFYRVKTIHYR